MKLTPKQLAILRVIHDWRAKHGTAPTFEEIGKQLGITPPTVSGHVDALEAIGAITRTRDKWRSIELTDDARERVRQRPTVPHLGQIQAGPLTEAVEDREDLTYRELVGAADDAEYFVLTVRGNSMVAAGIHDGDRALVRRADDARPGDIVVVLDENGEATLKKIFKHRGSFRLQPCNPKMKPIYVKEVRIQGVLHSVIRRMK